MPFMKPDEHQTLIDELRGADEIRITEIAVALSENYVNVVTDDSANRETIAALESKAQKLMTQNNELFLAATANARSVDTGVAQNKEQAREDNKPEFLAGMFDERGNLIPPKT